MAYTTNPNLPKVRARAVNLVRQGKSIRYVARYFGFNPSTVSRWNRKVPSGGCWILPTASSRPRHHPKELSLAVVKRIVSLRKETRGRCAEVIHRYLLNEKISVGLSSVKRVLKRQGLIKQRSPWKRYHLSPKRPKVANPGDLIQLDTIHLAESCQDTIYIYTLMDLCSRWAYAYATKRINTQKSIQFLNQAQEKFPHSFQCLQSDHGSEFSQHFSERARVLHRHSRVRRPNDNAHLERFNRTIQTEFLSRIPMNVRIINRLLPRYLDYYNNKRLHLGINLKTPSQILKKCCKAID